jgi:hypothetical protein
METRREVPAAVEALVDALLQSYGQLALIIDHMVRHTDLDSPPIDVVLHGMLGEILAGLPDAHGVDDVATAAQMVAAAIDAIASQVLLVDEPPSSG